MTSDEELLARGDRWLSQAPAATSDVVLTGPLAAAYRVLEHAAAAAQHAQSNMAVTGQALREAIQALCAVIAPGVQK